MKKNSRDQVQTTPYRPSILKIALRYLLLGYLALVAFISYLNWSDILKYVQPATCKKSMLTARTEPVPAQKPSSLQTFPQQKEWAKEPDADNKAGVEQTSENQPKADKAEFNARLQAARKMFWTKEPGTVAAYESLAKDYPENPQVLGELGNVYFRNGQLEKAANVFYKAGQELIKRKEEKKAAAIIRALEKLATPKAKGFAQELSAKLSQMR